MTITDLALPLAAVAATGCLVTAFQYWRLERDRGSSWRPRISTPLFGGASKSSSSDGCAPSPQPARPGSRRLSCIPI